MNIIPTVLTSDNTCKDIFSALLADRVILLEGEIDSQTAMVVKAQMLYLASQSDDDIELYIDSPGGSIPAGLSIIDMMNKITPDVVTICCGIAASMGAVILSAGAKGKRYILPHSEVMIHQPSTGFMGKESDIRIVAEHIAHKKTELVEILAGNCGQPVDKVVKDIESDHYMSASESVEYGIVDKVVE